MGNIISFAQKCDPPLKAGSYKLSVKPKTNIQCQLASETIDITVATNRFTLPPDAIYSVYPPREAVGNYTECLPHIVLNRRTLPWEQCLLTSHPTMPWLALLVFHEDEGIELIEGNCKEALIPDAGIYVPALMLQGYENPTDACTYLHVPCELLREILPYADDLTLLSHAKGVRLDDKVTDASVKDDWFATVVTNRYCLEPTDEGQVLRHIACLVSLEGYEHCLEGEDKRNQALSGSHTARMIVLANWRFSMSKASFDFGSTFSRLDAAMMTTPYSGGNPTIQQLSKLGYFPLNHHIRDGSQTVSWYQSPFIPYAEPRHELQNARFADQLLVYDPEIGMMDISYASAWQLGKTLALADQAFAQKLYAWRQRNQLAARTAVYHGLLQLHISSNQQATVQDWENDRLRGWREEQSHESKEELTQYKTEETLHDSREAPFLSQRRSSFLGQQFIQARRKPITLEQEPPAADAKQAVDPSLSDGVHNDTESDQHAPSSNQVLSQQLQQRYRSILREVIVHASKK